MTALRTFEVDAERVDIVEAMRTDGAAIIADVLAPDELARVQTEIDPWVAETPTGLDDFTGRQTTRTGALVARSEACRDLVGHELILDLANRFLGAWTERIQLHLTQVINIHPGQGAQPLHRDRLAWGGFLPREIEPQFNTIWAMTDFTTENGATRIVPGSVSWPDDQRAAEDERTQAEMSAGSVLLYSGSVIHSGGENRSSLPRTGINITYCLGWLRTEENQYLSCPPEIAKTLEPEMQELLGYTMGSYALGYYSEPAAVGPRADLMPPEFALGRKPRNAASSSALVDTATD